LIVVEFCLFGVDLVYSFWNFIVSGVNGDE